MLVNREKKHSAGRIMLHPLQGAGSNDRIPREEAACLDLIKGRTITLNFDFSEKPSLSYVEIFGRELNNHFERHVGVNRVRWGGMRRTMAARWARTLQAKVRRRRESMRLQHGNPIDDSSYARHAEDALDPLTPSSLSQHSPPNMEPAARRSPDVDLTDASVNSLSRPIKSNAGSEGHLQDHRERRKRRRTALDSESSS